MTFPAHEHPAPQPTPGPGTARCPAAGTSLTRKLLTHTQLWRCWLGIHFAAKGKFGTRRSTTTCHNFLEGSITKFCPKGPSWSQREHSSFTDMMEKAWVWQGGTEARDRVWHSQENRGFWQHKGTFLYLYAKLHFAFWGSGWDRSCWFPTNHFARCTLKHWAVRSDALENCTLH